MSKGCTHVLTRRLYFQKEGRWHTVEKVVICDECGKIIRLNKEVIKT